MTARTTRTALVGVALALVPRVAAACPVCFGDADAPLLDAARIGVITMVGVTLSVLAAFGIWFLRLRSLQRAAQVTEHGEDVAPLTRSGS